MLAATDQCWAPGSQDLCRLKTRLTPQGHLFVALGIALIKWFRACVRGFRHVGLCQFLAAHEILARCAASRREIPIRPSQYLL